MRVGLAVIDYPAEPFLVDLVAGLRAAGVHVTVLRALPRRAIPGALLRAAARHPLDLLRFVRHCWRHRRTLPFLPGLLTRLHVVGARLDVLHIAFDTQAAHLLDLKDYLRCKLVLSARGSIRLATPYYRLPDLLDRLRAAADAYHVLSGYLAAERGLTERVHTIPPAVDPARFSGLPDPGPGPLRVLCVGRLAWAKGYEDNFAALARLRALGVAFRVTVVGAGRCQEAVRLAARQLALPVVFAGAVPHDAVPGYLRRADVLLHLAWSEGFGNAPLEAQAMGVPVVASDAGGLPENIADGVTGFIVPRRDPAAAAEKLALLARSPDLRARMGQAGRARVRAAFTLDRQIAAWVRLYGAVVAQP